MTERWNEPAGYLAEFQFMHEGMRQDQRERQGFLGFTLAANGLVLGLLMNADPPLMPREVCFVVSLAAIVAIIAEQLTIRASQGVAVAGAYLRVFIEPKVGGLGYQGRNPHFKLKGRVSASRAFGLAYLGVTATFVFAWFVAPVGGDRSWWETAIVLALGVVSLVQVSRLLRASYRGWEEIDEAWREVAERDDQRQHDEGPGTT